MCFIAVKPFAQGAHRYAAAALWCALGCMAIAQAQPTSRFALSAEMAVPANAAVVRVKLPLEVLAGLHSSQGEDFRVVNGNDAMLPFAIVAAPASQVGAVPVMQAFKGYPIYEQAALGQATPALRIIENNGQRLVELSGATAPVQQRLRGLLYDTRGVQASVRSIAIRGDLPPNELLHVTLMRSHDLKDWQAVAVQQPLFQFEEGGPGNSRIRLQAPLSLKDQYLRLSWDDGEPFPEAEIGLELAPAQTPRPPDVWPLGQALKQGEDFAEWALPAGYAVQALRVQSQADNSLMPVRILTREHDGLPWRMVANTVVYRLPAQQEDAPTMAERRNPALPLAGSLASQLRIEAADGYVLAGQALELALEYTPMSAVFVASGQGPFRLLAGADAVQSLRLPISTVMPGYQAGMEERLPEAQVLFVQHVPQPEVPAQSWLAAWLNQRTLLWAVLIGAVVVLGALALNVLRSTAAGAGDTKRQ